MCKDSFAFSLLLYSFWVGIFRFLYHALVVVVFCFFFRVCALRYMLTTVIVGIIVVPRSSGALLLVNYISRYQCASYFDCFPIFFLLLTFVYLHISQVFIFLPSFIADFDKTLSFLNRYVNAFLVFIDLSIFFNRVKNCSVIHIYI